MARKTEQRRRPPTPDEVSVLFHLTGKAIWLLQHLEDALSTSIALKSDLKDAAIGTVPLDHAASVLKRRRQMTLGAAVAHAKKNALYTSDLLNRLERILDERNWLVHRLVHENGSCMNLDGSREALYTRIGLVSRSAHTLQRLIGSDLQEFVASKGADLEKLNAQAYASFKKDRGFIAPV